MLLVRWNRYAPLIVTVVTCLTSMAFANSHYDGSYVGTMECDQIPGYTRGSLKTAFVLSVAGGRAQYERRHVLPPTGLGPAERGAGTVSSTGDVSLTGEAGDLMGGYEATYHDQIEGKFVRLSGVQVWLLPDKATYKRSCTITVSRSE